MPKGPKVLIIEDNEDLAEMYKLKLSLDGFEVEVAYDGEQGILKTVDKKPDLILLDLLMPNMTGFEFLRALRKNTSVHTKIIVLSNLGQAENIKEAMDLGATEYMVKANTTPTMVVSRIKEILGMTSETKKDDKPSVDEDQIKVEKLEKYKKLLDEGVITAEEFEKMKNKILFE